MNQDKMGIVKLDYCKLTDIKEELYKLHQNKSENPRNEVMHHIWEDNTVMVIGKGIPQDISSRFAANKIKGSIEGHKYIFTRCLTNITSQRILLFLCDNSHEDVYALLEMPYTSVRQIWTHDSSTLNITFEYEKRDINIIWLLERSRPNTKAGFIWLNTFSKWLSNVKSLSEGDIIADVMTSPNMSGFLVPPDFPSSYERELKKERKTLFELGLITSNYLNPPKIDKSILRYKLKQFGLPETNQDNLGLEQLLGALSCREISSDGIEMADSYVHSCREREINNDYLQLLRRADSLNAEHCINTDVVRHYRTNYSNANSITYQSNIQTSFVRWQSAGLITQSKDPTQVLSIFSPSLASIPIGITTVNNGIQCVIECLANRNDGIQSFFGSQELSREDERGIYIRDEILHITPFDEKLWCQIFREAGRYKIADLYDQRHENAHKRGEKFKKFGILAGIFTLNPLVPFMAYSQGVSGAPKGSKLDELIPDPQIEFLKDPNSYSSMTNMGGVIGRRRRMIMHKMEGTNGCYYRLIPAIVTHEHIIPCQVFDFEGQNFLRPIAAGIDRNQDNYDAAKISRRYYHLRNEGKSKDTGERIKVLGDDIEEQYLRVFSFSSDITNLEYFYIEYATMPNHVF